MPAVALSVWNFFDDVEWENRQQLVKTEEQQKIRGSDLYESRCPKFWKLRIIRID